ncbi:hypothetical protein HanRHA438_Chr09g0386501 [Helianthus annuus]|uniref:Zinc finger, RING/FYVE/PHD-type n=1 Tax=Helianthus annuus TaxID=4232 RepID=A0A251TU59_HELAN|nr:hypothetical protein HanIR_Chr09g0404041 [Helianthus annuus]KAJ0887059.1 hypothetical protein HanRHA438_Chr09g0386501 [Helianthus annuus]
MGSQGVKFFCSTCKIGVEGCVESGYALLLCGHRIRLDSFMISAFIVKGEVECGNCRKAEEGQWLILDRLWPSPEYGVDNSDILGYASDLTPPGSAPFPGYSVHADAVSNSFPNGFGSLDSLMEHPYPDSVARAAMRAQALESYILQARNQRHVGSFSEQPQDGSA